MGVSILKLLGLENFKTVTPSQVAAFLMRKFTQKGDSQGEGWASKIPKR